MTQPPSPSAEALDFARDNWRRACIASRDFAFLLDAFAAQVVAVERAARQPMSEKDALALAETRRLVEQHKTPTYYNANFSTDYEWREANIVFLLRLLDTTQAEERAKPAASDHEAATKLVNSYLVDIGVCNDGHTNYEEALVEEIAAALAERGRVEREQCAQLIEAHKTAFKDAQSTWKRVTFTMLAAAIRNAGEPNG